MARIRGEVGHFTAAGDTACDRTVRPTSRSVVSEWDLSDFPLASVG